MQNECLIYCPASDQNLKVAFYKAQFPSKDTNYPIQPILFLQLINEVNNLSFIFHLICFTVNQNKLLIMHLLFQIFRKILPFH